MANTVIQLKYSTVTNTPSALNIAEPAYSYSSNTLFIGTPDGNGALPIGGYNTYTAVNNATDANTNSTIVKRDSSGGFSATYVKASLFGNANTATRLENGRNFAIDGQDVESGSVGFDGSFGVTLQGNLKTTGVSSGSYGGATQIPTFTVDSKGRLSYAGNVAISTTLNFAGDTGSGSVPSGETLTLTGRDGISTLAVDANNTLLIDVDNTVVRTTGNQSINGDVAITGNLIVSGNTITQDVENITTEDSLIKLASNNASDVLDIGFYGQYNDGSEKFAGLIRDASDSGKFKLFTGETTDPSGNVVSYDASNRATLDANIEAGTVLIKNINVLDQANGAYALANSNATLAQNAYNQANTGTTIATGAFNQANAGFDKANSATNTAQAAFDLANGTAIVANTDYTTISVTGGHFGNGATIASFTLEANGRISQANSTLIGIAASQITTGTLSVARGGTGAATHTVNGVLLGQGTSAFTTASSSTEGHVLTINASGVPTFAHLSGGTF